MKIKQSLLVTILLFTLVIGLGSNSRAVYLEDSFDNELTEEAINMGKKYKGDSNAKNLASKEGFRFSAGSNEISNSKILHIAFDVKTTFYKLANLARRKAKKYQTPTDSEINDIINEKFFKVEGIILTSEEMVADPDDLHFVFKTQTGEQKVIQPVNIRTDNQYSDGYYYGFVIAKFNYADFRSNKDQKELNMNADGIFISSGGEQKFEVDFSQIR